MGFYPFNAFRPLLNIGTETTAPTYRELYDGNSQPNLVWRRVKKIRAIHAEPPGTNSAQVCRPRSMLMGRRRRHCQRNPKQKLKSPGQQEVAGHESTES